MRGTRAFWLTVLVLAAAVVLAGCGGSSPDATGADAVETPTDERDFSSADWTRKNLVGTWEAEANYQDDFESYYLQFFADGTLLGTEGDDQPSIEGRWEIQSRWDHPLLEWTMWDIGRDEMAWDDDPSQWVVWLSEDRFLLFAEFQYSYEGLQAILDDLEAAEAEVQHWVRE